MLEFIGVMQGTGESEHQSWLKSSHHSFVKSHHKGDSPLFLGYLFLPSSLFWQKR